MAECQGQATNESLHAELWVFMSVISGMDSVVSRSSVLRSFADQMNWTEQDCLHCRSKDVDVVWNPHDLVDLARALNNLGRCPGHCPTDRAFNKAPLSPRGRQAADSRIFTVYASTKVHLQRRSERTNGTLDTMLTSDRINCGSCRRAVSSTPCPTKQRRG